MYLHSFNLISFFNDLISRITHVVLVAVLPDNTEHLSRENTVLYDELLQSSENEKRYFVRMMIVGKENVGKTCLLRRLLKDSIDDVSSTDGIDIVVHRCKINIENGAWTIGKGKSIVWL